GRRQEYEEKEYFEPVSVESRDLYDHLRDQLVLLRLSPRQVLLGEEIIGNIDENGYLTCSLEEVVKGLNLWLQDAGADWAEEEGGEAVPFTLEDGDEMLRIIQAFDPAGIGARDLRECLVLQLQDFEMEDTLAYRIVREYFDQLINHRWSEISKDLSITPKDVQSAADEIAKLDPKPGLKYSAPPDNYITPDLIVEKIDGEYLVFLNDTSLPRLKLSRAYREIAKDKSKFKGENKEFISNKLNSANWMIQAIEQRRQTMLKVMNFIVDRQREFFEKGVQYLKPLTLREVAEVINMHESTVSRVTNEKFVQTPRGVLPLKFFFSSGLSTTSGEDVSARGIKAKIQKLVSDEEAKRPLTDQAIVNILKDEGIQIARRTVAKYRDQLGILSARMRKRV
ncbi:MAG TPA: RNA polymerase factor sigma-54, partial [Longimicrobiales bacterium]|nr:RNA polymerase factor sigma-54 [Longimicrobiales bacterium]